MFQSFERILQQNAALKREKMASLENIAEMQIAGRANVARIGADRFDFMEQEEEGRMARALLGAEVDRERIAFSERESRNLGTFGSRSYFAQDLALREEERKRLDDQRKREESIMRYGSGSRSLLFGNNDQSSWGQWDRP